MVQLVNNRGELACDMQGTIPNTYVMESEDSFLNDHNVRCVSLSFKHSQHTNKKAKQSILLSKQQYVDVLNDIKAWKYIVFNHPLMSQDTKIKMRITPDGVILDDTPFKYGSDYRGFRNYMSYFLQPPIFPYDEDDDVWFLLETAHKGTIDLGGSDIIIKQRLDFLKHRETTYNNRINNPLTPEDDKCGKFSWKLIGSREEIHPGEEVASRIISYDENEELLFWAKRPRLMK